MLKEEFSPYEYMANQEVFYPLKHLKPHINPSLLQRFVDK